MTHPQISLSLPGYQITEEIQAGTKTLIYRAIRKSDQKPVILKALASEYPSFEELARLKHEYEITRNLESNRIIKPLAIEAVHNTLILVFADEGGQSLKQLLLAEKLRIETFLQIALQLTETLGELHQSQIVHKDIKPSNLIILNHAQPLSVRITDFSIATRLGRETQTLTHHPTLLEGTLAYMSPEQTGRMNRCLDYRTDFYSLGITFYEMLAGQLPFVAEDPLELIHCHIAKQPVSLQVLMPEIPQALSEIVMKLMAKTAEDRYQSAYGIKADLEYCLTHLNDQDNLKDFRPGKWDKSGKFVLSQKLYGRDREVASLLEAFNRIASVSPESPPDTSPAAVKLGTPELILIAGYSGIGKTSIVHEVHKPIVRQRGYFIAGKFDQFKRDIPYASLIQAFQSLIRQLLTEPPEQIAQWQQKLLAAVGENGQMIIDVIPEVESIIGQQLPIAPLGPSETQNRFNRVFKKFIHVFTQPEHPLVLFLDDLQWADSASLNLLELLMTDAESHHLLMIGAYRDNEVSPTHPFILTLEEIEKMGAKVTTIELEPLGVTHVTALISDSFSCTWEQAQPLAELIFKKTHGNPFFLTQLLKSLHQDGLLSFDFNQGVWQWNMEQIRRIGITENVVDLMAGKIRKFSENAQNVLKLAACIGNRFDLNILAIVRERSPALTAGDLWEALQEGLVLPLSESYKIPTVSENLEGIEVCYQFLHDRVQQAAYSLIPDAQKKAVHLKIGQLLLHHTPQTELEEQIFDIVNHLNIGVELLQGSEEKLQLARLNAIAGKKSKASNAYHSAIVHFSLGMDLLDTNPWETDYELIFFLHQELGECQYLVGNFDLAETLFNRALSQAKSPFERAEIYSLYIAACMTKGDNFYQAVELGIEGLKDFGINFPSQKEELRAALVAEQETVQTLLMGQNIADLVNLPEMSDPDKKMAMNLLVHSWTATYFANSPNWLGLMGLKMLRLTLEYGSVDASAFSYVVYGMILAGHQDYPAAYQFGDLALKLREKFPNHTLTPKINNIFAHTINPFWQHLQTNLPLYRESYKVSLETGDIVWGVWAVTYQLWTQLIIGNRLPEVYEKSEKYLQFIEQTNDRNMIAGYRTLQQTVLNLQGLTDSPITLNSPDYNETATLQLWAENQFYVGMNWFWMLKSLVLFLQEDYQTALIVARQADETIGTNFGFFSMTQHYFYYSLILTALYPTVQEEEKPSLWNSLQENRQNLKLWAETGKENFLHKYLLVEAEIARISERPLEAMELYDQAIASAQEQGYLQIEAIANELAAKFYLGLGRLKIAKTYLTDARYHYSLWGAIAKVQQLDKTYPDLLVRASIRDSASGDFSSTLTGEHATTVGNAALLDIATVMKASQTISSEIVLETLLEKLMHILIENAGAQKGHLLLHRQGKFVRVAEGTVENDEVTLLPSIPLENSSDLPLGLIHYVDRTQKPLLLNNALEEGLFTTESYIVRHQVKSVLCTPIVHQGKRVGLLYLENNRAAGAFTPDRLEVLRMLSAQAAISLELARVVKQVQDTVAYLSAIITNIADGLLVTDARGQITRVNPALLAMFDRLESETAGKHCSALLPLDLAQAIAQSVTSPNEVITAEVELAFERVGKAVATSILPQELSEADGAHCIGTVILIRDITTEKEIDRMKTDFISTVSHELRTPLTSVVGFAKLIQKKLQDKILPSFQESDRKTQKAVAQVGDNINIIISEGERLTNLINDVLDIAKMEAGKVDWQMQPLAVSELVERAFSATSSLFENSGLEQIREIESGLPEVMGDRDRLLQVLINLISNAVKFTRTGSVTVRAQLQNEQLKISVIDTGIGIPPEYQETVFEKFKQVGDTLTDKPKGTGLGLPICKQIVEHHQGQIWVESEEESGTTFSFTLPLTPESELPTRAKLNFQTLVQQLQQTIVPDPEHPRRDRPKTILVVDDEAHIRSLLRQELEASGYHVREAQNGMEAIAQVKAIPPDLILLDVMMPQISGFDVAAVLKNDPNTLHIPIAILSIIEDKQRGYRLGVDRYLTKPIDREDLLNQIGFLLSQETSKKKVLVVDEDVSAVKLLADVLEAKGYIVTEASSGPECLEKARAVKPDMIIVDSLFSDRHDIVKTLRFEKGLENVFFLLLAENQDPAPGTN
ncbi:AAA family ATPase [Laspinema olomoucense]|uniref:AAA family ATPase n=1 Tax=Laspinema olomoucense TaxID=3231600 RepID=UPI0021BA5D54|nr:AAA family ATPase [Laspinema sp. D3c]MCT7993687.1 AAA family ATPase [Laspinema sp. D3c]